MRARGFFLLFLLGAPALGHTQDTLPPVVVTSTRLQDVEQPASEVAGKVIVITAEDIKDPWRQNHPRGTPISDGHSAL